MNHRQQFLRVVGALLLVIAIGVIGYMAIEGWSFLDALYMTVITISTVGYKEIHELSSSGMVFSIVLIIGGVGVLFYSLTTIAQYVVEGHLADIMGRRRMKERIAKLKEHFILCGYGHVGREVARALKNEGKPFVVIDLSQEAIDRAGKEGCLYIQGNATKDDVLNEAGIKQAVGLVAAVGSDPDNISITLSAKGIYPNVLVVARAYDEESESKLKRAGADRVVFPLRLGGRRMAMLTLHPLVIDFIETTTTYGRDREMFLEDIKVGPGSPVVRMTLKEGQGCCGGAVVLAVKKKDGTLLAHPSPETLLELGDELVVIGTREQLRTLEG